MTRNGDGRSSLIDRWLPILIGMVMTALGAFNTIRTDTGKDLRQIDTRLKAVETAIEIRTPLRDQQIADIQERLRTLERRGQ